MPFIAHSTRVVFSTVTFTPTIIACTSRTPLELSTTIRLKVSRDAAPPRFTANKRLALTPASYLAFPLGLLLDSAGTALAHALALMTVRQGVVLFTFSTLKTVCDHGGYAFPWWLDPLHLVFPNCAEYHDVHHQMQGLRYNYSQPYFVHFDILFGTRMGSDKFHKIREANRKWKQDSGIKSIRDEHLSAKTTTKTKTPAAAAAAASTTSIAAAAQEGADTRTTRRRQPKSDDDAPPAQIAAKEKDPLVTTDLRSYRAKAGVAAS